MKFLIGAHSKDSDLVDERRPARVFSRELENDLQMNLA